ncbi:uncharacterized protein SCHCODRAFT_02732556 [Schizophyllum commune H4-8]|nr:uncharacterized protein SCHCODRAFT_02732556 [Schizophyllum commune H4-8]KAI5892180.1 hypothetical protein SCHCODRAFT_02732556 [Schizophyllum commune H4-8]
MLSWTIATLLWTFKATFFFIRWAFSVYRSRVSQHGRLKIGSTSRRSSVPYVLLAISRLHPRCTRPVRRRALLIGISYRRRNKDWWLYGTHGDVKSLRRLLVNRFGWLPSEITVMMDKDGVPDHLWPTEANIRRELKSFTQDCASRDRFVFLYAGHAEQKDELIRNSEADGKDEYIVPCDAPNMQGDGCILDNIHSAYPDKAFLDACHSATLLDLVHDKCMCPDGWVGGVVSAIRWLREQASHVLGIPISAPNVDNAVIQRHAGVERVCSLNFPVISAIARFSHSLRFCQGFCRRVNQPDDPWVICFSACKDEESAVEVKNVSMTKVLVRVLESDAGRARNPSLEELLSVARYMHRFTVPTVIIFKLLRRNKMAADFRRKKEEYLRRRATRELEPSSNPVLLIPSTTERFTALLFGSPFIAHLGLAIPLPPLLFDHRPWDFYRDDKDYGQKWPTPARLQVSPCNQVFKANCVNTIVVPVR